MSALALVNPATLLGQGIRESLGARGFEHDVQLLASDAEAEGTLTEIGGEVTLVHALSPEALGGVDLVIACGTPDEQHEVLARTQDGIPTIVVANHLEHPGGTLAVAGITETESLSGDIIVSPHPGVVGLCHLLAPLASLRPSRVAATLLLPTSMHDAAGVDELFAQTRDILNFQAEPPQEIFGHQLAFNLLPVGSGSSLAADVTEILGSSVEIAVQLLQAPVFHSMAISLAVHLEEDTSVDEVLDALHDSGAVAVAESVGTLGPIDAAASEDLLVGAIEPVETWPGAYTIWSVMDNLTRGGATNAVELAARILG